MYIWRNRTVIDAHSSGASYFSCVFPDTQIPDSDSSLGVEVLTGHVDIICVFIFILILAVMFPLLQKKKKDPTCQICFPWLEL